MSVAAAADDAVHYSSSNNQLEIFQVWLKANNSLTMNTDNFSTGAPDALNKDFLRKVWAFQDTLLDGIPSDDQQVFIHSPSAFWDNDLTKFEQDEHVLRTINKKAFKSSTKQRQVIINTGLLGDVVNVNGLIKSAGLLRIAMISPSGSKYGDIWSSNLAQYIEKSNDSADFKIIEQPSNSHEDKQFVLRISKMTSVESFIIMALYLALGVYFTVSLINLNSVRSRLGLLLGFSVEVTLAILSSATLTSFLYQGVDFHQIPLHFLPFVVLVVSIENMFRLVQSIPNAQKELSIQHKLSDALTKRGLTSTLTILRDCLIFWVIYPYVSNETQKFLFFVSLALIIDHVLHLTYFASILSIDLHRLELTDLLDNEDESESWTNKNPIKKSYHIEGVHLSDQPKWMMTVKRYFTKYRSIYNKFKITTLILVILNARWSNDSLSKSKIGTTNEARESSEFIERSLVNFLYENGFNEEILSLVNSSKEKILINVKSPKLFVLADNNTFGGDQFPAYFNTNISYKFDIYYVLEFLTLLIFILSIASIVLRYFTKNLTFDDHDKINKITDKEDSFQVKVLSGGHFLDIIKTATSNSSFIASIGLDHKVLIWSPVSKPLLKPTQLPINPNLWPIINVVISDSGNFITVFSKTGVVHCWSRLSMTWIWKFEIPELKGDQPLETFFRHKTIPAFLQRKRAAANRLTQADELVPRSRRNSLRSIAAPQLKPTDIFSNNIGINTEIIEDLIVVLKTGVLLTISCQEENNVISREKLSGSNLVSSSKLITPRVNDRLISYTEEGRFLVSTAVNNRWKTRTVNVNQNTFNNPNQELTIVKEETSSSSPPPPPPPDADFSKTQIAVVPFVGFMVKAYCSTAELIDVQTGTLIKNFKINPFIKQKSLQVFHDQPTHCRFCGSVSIASFSIAYSLKNSNSMVMHTFKADHKAKTSICLRVERDPREIRCVGFNQVTEQIYQVDDVEGWHCNDQNEILGLKKKSEDEIIESTERRFKKDSVLRHRKTSHRNRNNNFPGSNNDETSSRLYNLWEGWKINADGKFETLKIPDVGNAEGLLVNTIGEISKFGHKSIVAVFGNIMKILYLGNDELIYSDDKQKTNSLKSNEEISGLTFINRRRKLNKDKHHERFNNATNFSEFDSVPGLSVLAL